MKSHRAVSRRKLLKLGVAASALPLVHIRTGRAAGTVSIAFWDHWVPAGNDVMRKQCAEFAKMHNVEVRADFITSMGNKQHLTIAAEAQAGAGHDVHQFPTWEVQNHRDKIEPIDDVMQQLIAQYGPVSHAAEYLATSGGHWLAVPTSSGSQNKPPCARISILKEAAGIDVVKMYPAAAVATPEAAQWDYEAFLKVAEGCHKANKPIGIGVSPYEDYVDFAGAMFTAFGAELVDGKGNVTIGSEPVREVLEYAQRLVRYLPADGVSWDNASNNRALISGKSALICNPPSAWAVAKRDAPQIAADCWTFSMPKGPKGRFVPSAFFSFGVWRFSPNKTAAKELIAFLSQRDKIEERDVTVVGYDIPPFLSMSDFRVWSEVEPPKGTVYNYPVRPHHHAEQNISGSAAPPDIAVQMYARGTMTTMLAKLQKGQSIKQVSDWASQEIEGFTR